MASELLEIPGLGPYELPVAQSVRVDVRADVVTVVARVLAPNGQDLLSIGIPMTAAVADSLLAQLPTAIVGARQNPPPR